MRTIKSVNTCIKNKSGLNWKNERKILSAINKNLEISSLRHLRISKTSIVKISNLKGHYQDASLVPKFEWHVFHQTKTVKRWEQMLTEVENVRMAGNVAYLARRCNCITNVSLKPQKEVLSSTRLAQHFRKMFEIIEEMEILDCWRAKLQNLSQSRSGAHDYRVLPWSWFWTLSARYRFKLSSVGVSRRSHKLELECGHCNNGLWMKPVRLDVIKFSSIRPASGATSTNVTREVPEPVPSSAWITSIVTPFRTNSRRRDSRISTWNQPAATSKEVDNIFEEFADKSVFSLVDLTDPSFQVPSTEESKCYEYINVM